MKKEIKYCVFGVILVCGFLLAFGNRDMMVNRYVGTSILSATALIGVFILRKELFDGK